MKFDRLNSTLTESQLAGFLVFFASFLGLLVRLALPLASSVPLNDGGLFFVMTRDLQANHYVLPVFTSYNDANIPFAYPPLAFYFIGLLSDLTQIPLLDIFRLLPAMISAFAIPVIYLLAAEFLPSKISAAFVAFLLAFTPRAFEWLIMGGGITRSFGFLFALLTIYSARRLFITGAARYNFITSIWATLMVLSHPEAIPHTILAGLVILFFSGLSRKNLLSASMVAGLVILFAAPWWVVVILRHSIDPFLAAAATAQINNGSWFLQLFSIFRFEFTSEPYIAWIAMFSLVGAFHTIFKRSYLLPIWLLLHYLLEPRSGTLYMLVPMLLLAAIGMDLILSIFSNPRPDREKIKNGSDSDKRINYTKLALFPGLRGFFLFITAYLLVASYVSAYFIYDRVTLKDPDLQAMTWISENTPPTASFLLVTDGQPLLDPQSDWFPALTGRKSLATVFGYEWVPDGRFSDRIEKYSALQDCAHQSAACLDQWLSESNLGLPLIYIKKAASTMPLEDDLRSNTSYKQIYENSGVVIIQRSED